MRSSIKAIALSFTLVAFSFGAISCSSPAPEVVETNTQEQLTKRNAAEAKKTLDGFLENVSTETVAMVKPENSVAPEAGQSGTDEDVAAANLSRVKQGYPLSYAYLDEAALGTAGTVKLIALYANPVANTPGLTYETAESDIKLDGDQARIIGSSIKVKAPEGASSDFRAGDITLMFKGGKWLITDFGVAPSDRSMVS